MEALTAQDLKQYDYFACLSDSALDQLAQKLHPIDIPQGTQIIRQGTPPDYFYFVRQGEVQVLKESAAGHKALISVVSRGQGLGEVALLTCSHRTCSVVTKTDASFYRLTKNDFSDILIEDSNFKCMLARNSRAYARINKIKTLQPFALLEPEKMYALMDKLIKKTYAPGENIVVQGERGDNYYIIKSGRVAVLKRKKGEATAKQLAVLQEGEAFGEEALIRDDPRNATCQALDETTVYVLNKMDFNRIVKASYLRFIFPDELSLDTYLDDYFFIDARIPPEYEEEHIAGAVNIPIEILRDKCHELDPAQKYITHCLNDSRGMVAAFLMSNRGFDAQCLRGGVSGWPGPIVNPSDGIHLPAY